MDTFRAYLLSLSGEYLLAAVLLLSGSLTLYALYVFIAEALAERKQAKATRAHFEAMLNQASEGKERRRLSAIMERRKS